MGNMLGLSITGITLPTTVHCLLQPFLHPFILFYVSVLLFTKSIFVCAYLTMAVRSNTRVTLIHYPINQGLLRDIETVGTKLEEIPSKG